MTDEIIPHAHLKVKSDNCDCEWECPGCGWVNEVYLFSERLKDATLEAQGIQNVQCQNCGKKFDT
jgi:transcription elongation factor Elf1